MPAQVFGADAVVTSMNLALFGSSYSLSEAAYDSQVASASSNATQYANTIAATLNAAYPTNLAYATLVLDNMGVGPNPGLAAAVAGYLDSVGIANRGVVTWQLAQILSGLEGDANFGAAASAWNNTVADKFEAWSGANPGANLAMTGTPNETLTGTSGDDTFTGSSTTYQGGDRVLGGAGADALLLSLFTGNYLNVTLDSVETVDIDADGDVTVSASLWKSGTNVVKATNKGTGTLVINDLQETSNAGALKFELSDTAADTTFNFDQQAAQGDSTVEVKLTEVTGALAITGENGEAIETTVLDVQDVKNAASTLKSLTGTGSKTVEIKGGLAGQAFTITAPLDASLTTVNASTFVGNLVLDVSANGATKALALTGGSGDDKINAGDAWGDGDNFNGGAGANEITINFTTATDTTRAATMTKFQTANVAFNAPVSFEGGLVDDLKTVNLNASSARADFNNMDSTFDTLNIKANPAQGVEVDYDGKASTTLNINIQGDTTAIGNAGNKAAIRVINADTVNLTHSGNKDVVLSDGLHLDEQDANGRSTSALTITNASKSDMTINSFYNGHLMESVLGDTNDLETLVIETKDIGGLYLSGDSEVFMEEAMSLQSISIKAAANSEIDVGLIGNEWMGVTGDNPSDLETISIEAGVGAWIYQGGINADDSLGIGASAATVNTISVKGDRQSEIMLGYTGGWFFDLENDRDWVDGDNWLQAASIGTMTIASDGFYVYGDINADFDLDDDGDHDVDFYDLIGLDLEAQQAGSSIVVSGTAEAPGIYFEDETAALVDATGLKGATDYQYVHLDDIMSTTNDYTVEADFAGSGIGGLVVDWDYDFVVVANDEYNQYASKGFTFKGSELQDIAMGTNSADTFDGNGADDLLIGYGGADTLTGGAGNDILYGDSTDPNVINYNGVTNGSLSGNDSLVGGDGRDTLIGGGNKSGGGDVMWGGAGGDWFSFVFETTDVPAGYTEAGKSTNSVKQDWIMDFTPGEDIIQIDSNLAPGADYAIAYYSSETANAVFIRPALENDVAVVVRRGTYNANGTFNASATGADYQVLFETDGDYFNGTVAFRNLNPGLFAGGGQDFTEAAHEIAVIGLAGQGGSLSTTDIIFV